MLERTGLVLITPWSATVTRTKYELHSNCKPTHCTINSAGVRNCRV